MGVISYERIKVILFWAVPKVNSCGKRTQDKEIQYIEISRFDEVIYCISY